MVQFVSDLAALGAFGTAAWQIIGRWYRFRSSKETKAMQQTPFDAVNDALQRAAASGARPAGDWGKGAQSSGHAHVIQGWGTMSAAAKATLVEEMLQVAALTGQLQNIKPIREGRLKWSQLNMREQALVVAALDGLVFDELGAALKQQAGDLAGTWLWQVTEPVPMLAEELALSEPCSAELALLTKTFDKVDKAIKDVLTAERSRHLAALSDTLKHQLNTGTAATNLQALKSLLSSSGPLTNDLGVPAITQGTTDLRATLTSLSAPEDGALLPGGASEQAAVKEAGKKLQAQVEAQVDAARAQKESEAVAAARSAQVAHIVQVAGAPTTWSASAPLALRLAVVELVLGEVTGGDDSKVLVEAAQKLVPKLQLPEDASDLSARVTQLLAALSPAAAPAPVAEAEAEGEAPAAPAPAPGVAARELSQLLVTAFKDQLPPEQGDADSDEAVVASLVRGVFNRVLVAATPGGLLAAAAAGVAALDRSEVIQSIKTEAARKGEAASKPLLDQLESSLTSLRTSTTSQLLGDQMAAGEAAAAGRTAAEGLALAAAYIREVVLAGGDAGLAAAASKALALVRPDQEAALLSPAGQTAVTQATELTNQITLAHDLNTRLELGPGIIALLDRLDSYAATAADQAAAEPAATPAADATADGQEGGEEPQGNGHVEAQQETRAPRASAADWAKARDAIKTLTADGMVLLELSAGESRKLDLLRQGVDGCSANASGDALVFNRHLTTLKELDGQLGPIMTALEAKCGDAEGDRKTSLLAVKEAAMTTYKELQALMALEGTARSGCGDSMNELRDIVYSLKPQRSSALLESGLARLEGVKAKTGNIMTTVATLPGSEDAVSEVMVMEEQVDRVSAELRSWSDWVRLREAALGTTPASPSTAEEGAEISLPPPDEMRALHAMDDVEFIDLYGYHMEDTGDDQEEEVVAASTRTQEDEDEQADARQAAVLARVEEWAAVGNKMIARGQLAVVLLAGALDGNELRCTRDVGLPSTKSPLQLFAERLLKSQQLAATAVLGPAAGVPRPLDWYIVAPKVAHASLTSFLQSAAYFGLQPSQVHLVESDLVRPAFNTDLKICMEAPGRIAQSPACSGDVWVSLAAAGALKTMRSRGVRYAEVHALEDNLLVKPADPVFVGCCSSKTLDAAAKVCDPASLMHTYEGFAPLVSTAKAAEAFSRLIPALGSYCFSCDMFDMVESQLAEDPLHLYRLSPAAPKTPAGGKPAATTPGNTVAYRMDRHLSDWVVASGMPGVSAAVVLVAAEEEFAPVVGAPPIYVPPSPSAGVDSMLLLHTSWVEASGGELADPEGGVVEVSPLVSYAGEGLQELVNGRVFEEAYDLDLQGYSPSAGKQVRMPHAALTVPVALAWVVLAAAKVALKQ